VQISAALGAVAVAVDVDVERLAAMEGRGVALALDATNTDSRVLRREIRTFADTHGIPTWRTKIFETSGQPGGQALAYALIGHGSTLSVVGYTPRAVELRLSNLMAFDAVAQGNWGCLPEHYPAVVSLALSKQIEIEPFIERRPMSGINAAFADLQRGGIRRRIVLIPGR
jgi:6-hydroxycyclohex-1-ene-1-carbonyl-CoA dehydrogenase